LGAVPLCNSYSSPDRKARRNNTIAVLRTSIENLPFVVKRATENSLLCYNIPHDRQDYQHLPQGRQLEQAVADLAQTNNEAELAQAARAIAHTFPHKLILNLLVKHLDTPNGQIRGGLGHLASLLPAEEVLPALHNVAANRRLAS